jgi:hypothetical protein
MTREAEARSWDDTTVNVWHKLTACDHLLDTDSWKHGDPPQGQGISFATATRHLRILRRRIEEIMGTSARHQDTHQIWRDFSKEQWELLWSGETALRRYDADLWASGHKTVSLLPDETTIQTPHIMCITGPGDQRQTAKVPSTKGLPHAARQTIEQYLKLVDWASLLANKGPQENDQSWTSSTEFLTWQGTQPAPSQDMDRLIQNLIHDPSDATLLEELEDIKHTMSQDTPLSRLIETLTEELWKEEQFQGGNLSIHLVPGLQTVWHHLTDHIKQNRRVTGDTIRSWRITLVGENSKSNNRSECSKCQTRHMTACNTCYLPRCVITSYNDSKNPCPTYQEINTLTPDTLGTDIPSANLHVKGLYFVERISGVGSIPRRVEMQDENTDPQTDPNIRFQVVVRGWSDQNHQTRAKTLLALPTDTIIRSLQHHPKAPRLEENPR